LAKANKSAAVEVPTSELGVNETSLIRQPEPEIDWGTARLYDLKNLKSQP
jgi:hypothetical protein